MIAIGDAFQVLQDFEFADGFDTGREHGRLDAEWRARPRSLGVLGIDRVRGVLCPLDGDRLAGVHDIHAAQFGGDAHFGGSIGGHRDAAGKHEHGSYQTRQRTAHGKPSD